MDYKLTKKPNEQYGAIWLINKDKLPSEWDGMIITSKRESYENELVHVMRINISPDQKIEIYPEEKGKMEYDHIVETCDYAYTATEELMKELKKYL